MKIYGAGSIDDIKNCLSLGIEGILAFARFRRDLEREAPGRRGCRIPDISPYDVVTFDPDTLRGAYRKGFDYCPFCIGEM